MAAGSLAAHSISEEMVTVPHPLQTFSTLLAAFNLNQKPDIPQIAIDSLAEQYNIPDLRPALLDIFSQRLQNTLVYCIGGCQRTQVNTQLPFDHIMVWFSFHMQTWLMDNGPATEP